MEAVASVASIAQLTRYAITLITTISELHEQIKGQPAQLRKRIRQLETLNSTVGSIGSNKPLNTPIILEHLGAIATKIDHLNHLLEKEKTKQQQSLLRRYCKAWLGASKEPKILDILNDLEIDKSALSLSIAEVHTKISGRIQKVLVQRWPSSQGRSPAQPYGTYIEKESPCNTGASADRETCSSLSIIKDTQDLDMSSRRAEDHKLRRARPASNTSAAPATRDRRHESQKDQPAPKEGENTGMGQEAETKESQKGNSEGHHYGTIKVSNGGQSMNGSIGEDVSGVRHEYDNIWVDGEKSKATNGAAASDANFWKK